MEASAASGTTSLSEAYTTIAQKYHTVNELAEKDSSSEKLSELISQTLDSIAKLWTRQTNGSEFFSKNEELDDISTRNLKFLMLPFFAGIITSKYPVKNRSRLEDLNSAKRHFLTFLQVCEDTKIANKEDIKGLHDEKLWKDPAMRRNELIARERRDKESKLQLAKLLKKKQEMLSKHDDLESEESKIDDELERELVTVDVQLKVRAALRELRSIEQELDLLAIAPPPGSRPTVTGPPPDPRAPGAVRNPPPMQSQALNNVIFQTNQRDEKKKQVFQPGWRQPTQTIEEAVEEEIRRGGMVSSGTTQPKQEKTESDDDDNDEEYRKKRAWDDWKDDNPAGSGNRNWKQG